MPPAVLLPLPLTSLWVTDFFLGVVGTKEEVFFEAFELNEKETLSVDSISMKAPVCDD